MIYNYFTQCVKFSDTLAPSEHPDPVTAAASRPIQPDTKRR